MQQNKLITEIRHKESDLRGFWKACVGKDVVPEIVIQQGLLVLFVPPYSIELTDGGYLGAWVYGNPASVDCVSGVRYLLANGYCTKTDQESAGILSDFDNTK